MRGFVKFSFVAVFLLIAGGCPQGESRSADGLAGDGDGDASTDEGAPVEPIEDEPDGGLEHDAGEVPSRPPVKPPADPVERPDEPEPDPEPDAEPEPEPEPDPEPTPRTDVPEELVGTWQASPIDLELWESYREGQYAGRNSVPSRESMTFRADGSAKFYRYEQLFPFYEELVDCEGTVAFHDDGTFTFYPVEGRKRFYDSSHSENNRDSALSAEELLDPKWAGTRAYMFDATSQPPAIRISVPTAAPYNWYKVE